MRNSIVYHSRDEEEQDGDLRFDALSVNVSSGLDDFIFTYDDVKAFFAATSNTMVLGLFLVGFQRRCIQHAQC